LIADLLGSSQPDGWPELRTQAAARLQQQDLPTTREEDWKYCDFGAMKDLRFSPAAPAEVEIKEHILPEARGTRLVFVNGFFDAHHSCISGLPAGVRFMHLATATEAAHQLGGLLRPEDSDVFANLNSARFSEGAYLFVPKGVKVESPLHLLFLSRADGAPTCTQPRILVVLERGASAELIEEYQGQGTYFTNTAVEVFVAEGADFRHERIQRESPEAFHVSNLRGRVEKNATYHSRTITFGARISRQTPQIVLAAEGGDVSLDGLALLGGSQLADTHSLLDHSRPRGTSRQLHKCIVDEESHAVFNGRILVRPHAVVTDSRQQSRTLLLSDQARVDTKPQLEIDADDVKCAHGAAVGALDPEEIFYLRSRGLNDQDARNLLTYGFAADLLAHIPVVSLRRQLRHAVLARTNAGFVEIG
jgi:Fe-S cluster assembly protein SufD